MSKPPPQVFEVAEKITLAYRDLFDVDPTFVQKYGPSVKELDLTSNNLRDLTFLKGFPRLETLVLDGNEVNSHTKFPLMEKLHTLWVNSNKITNLIIFIDKLVASTPNIKFLSMLKNEACPNYFTGKSLQEYTDYRKYVISRLPTLTTLDSSAVTEEERIEANKLYASLPLPSKLAVVTDDIRAPPIKKPEPEVDKKKKKKRRSPSEDLPHFLNGGTTMGPPPPAKKEGEEGEEGEEEDTSDFSSEGGIDSEEWTDEEVEEDKEEIVDTHVWKGPGPEPQQKPKKKK